MVEARQASGGGVRAKELRLLLGVASSALVAVGVAAIAAAGFAAASVYRHDHFGSNAYGLGIYEQMIWGYSRLEPTMDLTVGAAGAPNLLGSHFQLILAALAPLYWIWDDVRMLLVAQAVLLALSSVPLFLWARRELGLAGGVVCTRGGTAVLKRGAAGRSLSPELRRQLVWSS
jgi:hypothetical protein